MESAPECLPHGRHQGGDRHLNFYDVRDNLAPQLARDERRPTADDAYDQAQRPAGIVEHPLGPPAHNHDEALMSGA
jgi:hypothetical protein